MASSRRRNKRKKMMGILKTTLKIKAKNPNSEMKDCIKTATELHNTAEQMSKGSQIKKI